MFLTYQLCINIEGWFVKEGLPNRQKEEWMRKAQIWLSNKFMSRRVDSKLKSCLCFMKLTWVAFISHWIAYITNKQPKSVIFGCWKICIWQVYRLYYAIYSHATADCMICNFKFKAGTWNCALHTHTHTHTHTQIIHTQIHHIRHVQGRQETLMGLWSVSFSHNEWLQLNIM